MGSRSACPSCGMSTLEQREKMSAHASACELHPLHEALKERDALRAKLESIRRDLVCTLVKSNNLDLRLKAAESALAEARRELDAWETAFAHDVTRPKHKEPHMSRREPCSDCLDVECHPATCPGSAGDRIASLRRALAEREKTIALTAEARDRYAARAEKAETEETE